ncbi:MAG: alpha/beta fold hydrolase [Lewinellaceae bacterium]|nr:alpha/beta fold hydrolase [Lewinellaceae bacterium]
MKQTLLNNGRRIVYYPDGPEQALPLVLLHGFCEDASLWDGLLPGLRDVPLLRIDLPGFGGSDLLPAPGMDGYADAVCAVLNDLSIGRCVLVGHSMGGYVALEFVEKYPDRLAGFGLIHSHPWADTSERIENRRRGIDMLRSGKRDLYVTQLFPGLFAEAFAKANPEIINLLIEQGKRQPAEGIIAALESMIDRKEHLETVRNAGCPVLFLLGAEDPIIPSGWALQAALLPAVADVHVLPGVGHMGILEAPEKLVEIVQQFWQFCARR